MLFPRSLQPGIAIPTIARDVTVSRAALVVACVALIAAIPHAINMWAYPAFTIADDEGIYVSQAIAWLRSGALAPYTYTYDHAPGGWIQLALFYAVTGGTAAFGTPIDGGRVLMLLFHIGSALLLFRLARLLSASMLGAMAAVVLFSVSPLAVFYDRMVLLDNIMMFWLLASFVLALDARSRAWIALSGITFGVALLSKESAAIFAPVLVAAIWRRSGWKSALLWCAAAAIAVLPYPAYALSRGELWPNADPYLPYTEASSSAARPSLLSTLFWQLTRSGGGTFSLTNQFVSYLRTDWLWRDTALLAGGVAAIVANAVRGRKSWRLGVVAAAGLVPCLYLARGGVTFAFYIAIAVPFLALNAGVLLDALRARFGRTAAIRVALVAFVLLLGTYAWNGTLQSLYVDRPDGPGRAAEAWMKAHVPPSATIIGRDDHFAYLREANDGPAFADFQIHWRIANDPNARQRLRYDWSRIDYLVIDPHELVDFASSDNWLVLAALRHAHKVASWTYVSTRPQPLHPDQTIEIWEADRLLDPDPAASSGTMFRGRDQACGPRVASCDELTPRSHPVSKPTARSSQLVKY